MPQTIWHVDLLDNDVDLSDKFVICIPLTGQVHVFKIVFNITSQQRFDKKYARLDKAT